MSQDILIIQKRMIENKTRIALEVLFPRLSEALETLNKQYHMLKDLLSCGENEEELINIQRRYENMGIYAIRVHSKDYICWNMVGFVLNFLLKNLLGELLHITQMMLITGGNNIQEEKMQVAEIQILVNFIMI